MALALPLGALGGYAGNMGLRFSAAHADVVRVPHETSMNGPLITSWTVELWVKASAKQQRPASGRHVNLVSFPGRHPSLSMSVDGFATASLRTTNNTWYSYEGSTPLNDGKWHHVAATWDGTSDDEGSRELYLFVDGNLETPGMNDEDGMDGPKTPEAIGFEVVRDCVGGLCEEGLQIGGLYCCGGQGYSGKYFNGSIDEVRVWSRALEWSELTARMNEPLYAGDQDQLLFYFPLDEAGMEMGSNIIQSTALYWYGMLGNALGGGRPSWVVSDAPISCTQESNAPACVRLAEQSMFPTGGFTVAHSTVGEFFYLGTAAIFGALFGVIFTYASITGQLPPLISRVGRQIDFLLSAGYAAAPSTSISKPGDWTWASPPREQTQPATPAPPPKPRTYGSV